MKQREIHGQDNIVWMCVESFSGVGGKTGEQAREHIQNESGLVPVVCTPSGGERSVRLELPPQWQGTYSDNDLLDAISRERTNAQ